MRDAFSDLDDPPENNEGPDMTTTGGGTSAAPAIPSTPHRSRTTRKRSGNGSLKDKDSGPSSKPSIGSEVQEILTLKDYLTSDTTFPGRESRVCELCAIHYALCWTDPTHAKIVDEPENCSERTGQCRKRAIEKWRFRKGAQP